MVDPPSVTIKSVTNPAHNPTNIPIRIQFVVCLLPELYISIEINAPPAMERKNTDVIVEVHKLPMIVQIKVGPPPIRPARIKKPRIKNTRLCS